MRVKKRALWIILTLLTLIISQIVLAQEPNAPADIGVTNGLQADRGTIGVSVDAQAGNVSRLDINDSRITDHWQGYFGNVTGEITLDDAFNNTLFSWVSANPQGEIFASNTSSVTWEAVHCVNFSEMPDGSTRPSSVNLSILENLYGINGTESDGINETYTSLYTGTFDVGSVSIDSGDECPLAYGYVNNASQSSNFANVLLTTNESILFTTIVSPATGFNGQDWDFELLVAENGLNNEDTTTYYFFVELT